MVNLNRPPLPPNRPYYRPLNYLEYVKDFWPKCYVRVFKVVIRTNGEIEDVEIVDLFSFTFKDTMSDWCNNYMGNYSNRTFTKL